MGNFTELKDKQWKILEPLMPPPPPVWKCGRKCTHWRKVLNTIFCVLTTEARWQDVAKGPQWASRSSAHRYLVEWQEDGTWQRVLSYLEELADMCGMIDVERLKIDGFFSAGKGGGAEVDYGYKGKGMTNHLLVDKEGDPLAITTTAANGDEREQVVLCLTKRKFT